MANDRRGDAIAILRQRSILRAPHDRPFVLKSGGTSLHYVDVRIAALCVAGNRALGEALLSEIHRASTRMPNLVAGVVLGGCPLATAVSRSSGIDAVYVRPEPKGHGAGRRVEGGFAPGDRVVVVEDVVTEGTSTLRAVEALRDAGLDVAGVVAVLDRQAGGGDRIAAAVPWYRHVVTLAELLAGQP